MELTGILKTIFTETAKTLKGSARRIFMARTVKAMGKGGNDRQRKKWDGIGARSERVVVNYTEISLKTEVFEQAEACHFEECNDEKSSPLNGSAGQYLEDFAQSLLCDSLLRRNDMSIAMP